jgi:hypothetical protein
MVWDVAVKILTAVLVAVAVGLYNKLDTVALELARVSERLLVVGAQTSDHEMRLRLVEAFVRAVPASSEGR